MMAIYCNAKIIHHSEHLAQYIFEAMETGLLIANYYYNTMYRLRTCNIHILNAAHPWNFKFSPVNNND